MAGISDEDIEQIKVMEFVKQSAKVPVIHIANQRSCSMQQGRLLKRMGVLPGVSDLFFPRGNDRFKGLWLELKTKTGKPSALQLKFISSMILEGYAAQIAYGADEAILMIKAFYSL